MAESIKVKIERPKIVLLGELIKSTWSDYINNWEKFGVLLIIPLALSFFVNIVLYFIDLYIGGLSPYWWLLIGIVTLVLMFFFLFLYVISYIAQFLLLKDLTQPVSFANLREWFDRSLPFFWLMVGVSLVYGIFSLIGFLLLVIPGIVFMVYYCFTVYFAILENNKFEGSFGLSRDLVRGYWWAVFGRFLFGLLLVYLFYLVVGGLSALFAWLLSRFAFLTIDQSLSNLIYNFFSMFVGLFIGPLTMIYTYNIYKSLKSIKK